MDLLHTVYVPPGDGPFPTVLALHGWGADARDLQGLAPYFPPGFLTLCPQGRIELRPQPGLTGYGWYPLVPKQPPEPKAFEAAAADLEAFLRGALDRYPIDRQRLVVLGFSQGGMMGYRLALGSPQRFAGLIALSSWLPEPVAEALPERPERAGFPVLAIHGTADPLIEIERGRKSKELLRELGVELTYEEFGMGHEIRPEAILRLGEWLGETVPAG